ncbi:MAG: hypothetical protein ACPGJE_08370, partial [Wenzhouxiangellaceae bacterium]
QAFSNIDSTSFGQIYEAWYEQFLADDSAFRLDATDHPEFDVFRWVDFWYPARNVIPFKRRVYQRALKHLEPLVPAFSESGETGDAG